MKRYSEAELIEFENVSSRKGAVIRELVRYIRATVGTEEIPPWVQPVPDAIQKSIRRHRRKLNGRVPVPPECDAPKVEGIAIGDMRVKGASTHA